MRLIFAGTPEFAATALEALVRAGHEVAAVYTQPDRRAGRGLQPTPSAVKQVALRNGLPVAQPVTLKESAVWSGISELAADIMVVAAYGLILPPAVLAAPRLGCVNIHASLLPRWRGAAPIQRAVLAGDHTTGITIMQMDAGLDTGPILLQESMSVTAGDTAGTLHDKLAVLGGRLIVQALAALPAPHPQPLEGVTYAAKVRKHEAFIEWSDSATDIARQIRAFNPFPGAGTLWNGDILKIWQAEAGKGNCAPPGEIIDADDQGILVSCGAVTALRVCCLQRAGGRALAADAFLAGSKLKVGDRLGS